MKKFYVIIFFSIFTTSFAQDEIQEIDIFVIDSYVTPEEPHKVILTFFTSENVKSKIKFDGNDELPVSDDYLEEHQFNLLLNELSYDSTSIPYRIIVENKAGKTVISDEFDLYLPEDYNLEITNNSNLLDFCIGGIWYLIPAPTLILSNGSKSFGLTKEFPIVSFYNAGYNYPSGYIALEYSHLFDSRNPNYLRVGYKHIFQTKIIKYISPGINLTTNFNGFNGVSAEVSLGLFNFYETFTLYTRYRHNYGISNSSIGFSEISIGLFTSSISFNF